MNDFFGNDDAVRQDEIPRLRRGFDDVTTDLDSTAKRSTHMKPYDLKLKQVVALLLAMVPAAAFAFTSGSTGADGAFSPTVNTTVALPPNGIFNYTTVNIPAGVTVTYTRNVTNT